MPTKLLTPEEWFELTGERGSVYFGTPPAKKSDPLDIEEWLWNLSDSDRQKLIDRLMNLS
jgi:hypothetical protein